MVSNWITQDLANHKYFEFYSKYDGEPPKRFKQERNQSDNFFKKDHLGSCVTSRGWGGNVDASGLVRGYVEIQAKKSEQELSDISRVGNGIKLEGRDDKICLRFG